MSRCVSDSSCGFESKALFFWLRFTGIPSTLISYRFGYRASVIVGGLLSAAGFTMAIFCTELHELYLSIGVVAGTLIGRQVFIILRLQICCPLDSNRYFCV